MYEDDEAIAFLQRFQTVLGYVLVAPKEHREDVVVDFSEEEYLADRPLSGVSGWRSAKRCRPSGSTSSASAASRAMRTCIGTVVPLPPGVPFQQQQLAAIDTDLGFDLSEDELEQLAARIRSRLENAGEEPPNA